MRAAFIALSLMAPLVSTDFVAIDVKGPGRLTTEVGSKIGCLPAEFSGDPKDVSQVYDVVVADPIDACTELNNRDDVKGKVVLIKRGKCYFHLKADSAESAGAAGVIIFNNNRGQPPFPMAAPAGATSVGIPVCLTWLTTGEDVQKFAESGLGSAEFVPKISFGSFLTYHPHDEVFPHALTTSLSMTDGDAVSQYPTGQATYNPRVTTKVTGDPVLVTWKFECQADQVNDISECANCWTATNRFSVDLNGKIALIPLFRVSGIEGSLFAGVCYPTYESITWIVQQAGALGAVFLNREPDVHLLLPYLVAYPIGIPSFNMPLDYSQELIRKLQTRKRHVLELPALEAGSGPEYKPDTLEELNTTIVTLLEPSGMKGQYPAGQSNINPEYDKPIAAKVVKIEFKKECIERKCSKCLDPEKDDDMPILTSSDQIKGRVAFMRDDEMTCFWSLKQIMKEMAASGAQAVIFGARRDSTYSILVETEQQSSFDIPVFTIAASLSDAITKALNPTNGVPQAVSVKLPPLKRKGSAVVGPNYDVNLVEEALPTTKVQVKGLKAGRKGFEEVGYATFNPTDYGQVSAELVKLEGPSSCSDLQQCHKCESEENFVMNADALAEKVALIREEDFICVHPVSVLTCTLQYYNVRGVLYASNANELRTLESSGFRCNGQKIMKIPSFFVIKSVADRLVGELPVEVKLPGIRNGIPDSLAANPTDKAIGLESPNIGDSEDKNDFPTWLAILVGILAVALVAALLGVTYIYRKRRSESDRQPMLETTPISTQTEIALVPTSSGDEDFGSQSDRNVGNESASC